MIRTAIYVNYKDISSSEYKIDIFRIPNVVIDHLFDISARECDITRTCIFVPPIEESQKSFVTAIRGSHMDPVILPDHARSATPEMSSRLISDAYRDAFDLAVVVSGDSDMAPSIRETRSLGKRVMLAYFSDRISRVYKDGKILLDYDMLYLDRALDIIAMSSDAEISVDTIIEELENEFLGGNTNYDSINMKRYLTYWATRARFAQEHKGLDDEDRDVLRRSFERFNELSSQYRPGYLKALNKTWSPDDDWIQEIKRIPKTW
jgi:hypothetical protein